VAQERSLLETEKMETIKVREKEMAKDIINQNIYPHQRNYQVFPERKNCLIKKV
jgi:hypothetical protein